MATLADPSAAPAVPALAIAEAPRCPSCGTALAGEFCHACGERRHREERLSLRYFVGELWEEVFDLDSRALRSLRLVVSRPGFLTLEALRGRRRPYLGALRMYLAVFAAVVFLTVVFPQPRQRDDPKKDVVAARFHQIVHRIAVRERVTDDAAQKTFIATIAQHESWVAVLIPLAFAAELFLVFRRRRRWYGEHLLFATHFATFNYLFGLLLLPLSLGLLGYGKALGLTVGLSTFAALTTYLAVALHRVYGSGRAASVGWALLFYAGFGIAQGLVGLLAICTAVAQLLWL